MSGAKATCLDAADGRREIFSKRSGKTPRDKRNQADHEKKARHSGAPQRMSYYVFYSGFDAAVRAPMWQGERSIVAMCASQDCDRVLAADAVSVSGRGLGAVASQSDDVDEGTDVLRTQ